MEKDWWSICNYVMSNIVLNIATDETGFCKRGKRLEDDKWMDLQGSREREFDHEMYEMRCC